MSSNDADANEAPNATIDPAEVGPTVELSAIEFPADIGEGFQTLYGTDEPIPDAEAWIAATREGVEVVRGRAPTTDDLCASADGDHAFEPADGGESQRYVCVIDPIAYPFIVDEPGTVRSTTQVREETITIDVTEDGVDVSHPDAVVSIGVADGVESVEDVTPEVVYRQVCGFIHVFADEAEYETWAAEADGATTSVPVERGIGLGKAIADALFA